ncbi:carboxylesterase family protein [Fusarium austroafricanum]|uniref:Carboxylesterase family protein n=1 Tax=Fusarium austroafricanum TaxID=2364996 RepID=A0A8H4P1D8_9HYPO|nr:carboxylesterase family protein [Fusarium austroafricanum]
MPAASLLLLLAAPNAFAAPKTPTLPIVDLGYERHRALSYNETFEIYKFSNIRYALPPVGDLRFQAPVALLSNRQYIQIGDEVRACPQGILYWQGIAFQPISLYSNGKDFSLKSWEADIKQTVITSFAVNGIREDKHDHMHEYPRCSVDKLVTINGDSIDITMNSVNETR